MKSREQINRPGVFNLSVHESLFVLFYLGDANQDQTEAARMCGYSDPFTVGCRLMQQPAVQAAIRAKLDSRQGKEDGI